MVSKYCKGCNEEKDQEFFYLRNNKPIGHYCMICVSCKNKERWVNGYKEKSVESRKNYAEKHRSEAIEYGRNYYNSVVGRAKSMMKTIKKRMTKWGKLTELDFDESYLIELMNYGSCVETGIDFVYEKQSRFKCHPYSPSVDRVDSNGIYSKDNIRMVIWQYNLMKGEMTDDELLTVCERICNWKINGLTQITFTT